jgi:hypothetical protein
MAVPTNLPFGAKYIHTAHKAARETADSTSLAMTVFRHPDHGYSYANAVFGALPGRVLADRKTKLFVTWLPARYFV